MEKKKLLELAKQLNELKDKDDNSLAAKKVKTVAVSDDKLKASFLDACESIPEEKEELIPDDISDAYNELIKEDPREGGGGKETKEKEEEAKPTPKKKAEKETKKKATDVPKKEEAKSEEKKQTANKVSEKKEKTVTEKTEKKESDRTAQKYSHFIFCKKQLLAGKKDADIKQKLIDRLVEEGRKEPAAVLRAGEILKIMKIALAEE